MTPGHSNQPPSLQKSPGNGILREALMVPQGKLVDPGSLPPPDSEGKKKKYWEKNIYILEGLTDPPGHTHTWRPGAFPLQNTHPFLGGVNSSRPLPSRWGLLRFSPPPLFPFASPPIPFFTPQISSRISVTFKRRGWLKVSSFVTFLSIGAGRYSLRLITAWSSFSVLAPPPPTR